MKSRYAFLENPTEEVHTLCYSLKAYADHGLTYVVWYSDVPSVTYQAGLLELSSHAHPASGRDGIKRRRRVPLPLVRYSGMV